MTAGLDLNSPLLLGGGLSAPPLDSQVPQPWEHCQRLTNLLGITVLLPSEPLSLPQDLYTDRKGLLPPTLLCGGPSRALVRTDSSLGSKTCKPISL